MGSHGEALHEILRSLGAIQCKPDTQGRGGGQDDSNRKSSGPERCRRVAAGDKRKRSYGEVASSPHRCGAVVPRPDRGGRPRIEPTHVRNAALLRGSEFKDARGGKGSDEDDLPPGTTPTEAFRRYLVSGMVTGAWSGVPGANERRDELATWRVDP